MYICQNCLSQISDNLPSYSYTLKQRKKVYPPRSYKNSKGKTLKYPGGLGFETVKEIRVCQTCYLNLIDRKS